MIYVNAEIVMIFNGFVFEWMVSLSLIKENTLGKLMFKTYIDIMYGSELNRNGNRVC